MDLVKVPKLRTLRLQSFTNEIVELSEGNELLNAYVLNIKSKYDLFVNGITKAKSGVDRSKYDNSRDGFAAIFFDSYAQELKYPHHSEQQNLALEQLGKKLQGFDRSLIHLPMDDESAAIDNLLLEVETVDLTCLADTGLPRWLTVLKETNDEFKRITFESRNQETTAQKIESASKASGDLVTALNELFQYLFAKCITEPSEELILLYDRISNRIENYSN